MFYLSDMPNDVNDISAKLEALKEFGTPVIALDKHARVPLGYATIKEFKDARSSLNRFVKKMPGCAGDSGVFVHGRPNVDGKPGALLVSYNANCEGNADYVDPDESPVSGGKRKLQARGGERKKKQTKGSGLTQR